MGTKPLMNGRRSERLPRNIEVTLLGKANGFEYQEPARTVDLSDQGLGVLTDNPVDPARPMDTGQIVYILGNKSQDLGYCRIVWTRADHDRAPTRAGLQFLN